jgi:hypothetical protein
LQGANLGYGGAECLMLEQQYPATVMQISVGAASQCSHALLPPPVCIYHILFTFAGSSLSLHSVLFPTRLDAFNVSTHSLNE